MISASIPFNLPTSSFSQAFSVTSKSVLPRPIQLTGKVGWKLGLIGPRTSVVFKCVYRLDRVQLHDPLYLGHGVFPNL